MSIPMSRAAETPPDGDSVDLYQVDERVAPLHDPARNRTGLTESLLERVSAAFHAMPVESHDLVAAAESYASELPQSLDVIHLGLGDDTPDDLVVPGTGYTFGELITAQALGDYQALVGRERRVLRVNLGSDSAAGLAVLKEALNA